MKIHWWISETTVLVFISNSFFQHNKVKYNTTVTRSVLSAIASSVLIMSDSEFSSNTIQGIAAVTVFNGSVISIENSTFNNNHGGAVYTQKSSVFVSNCWFKQNSADYGAALGIRFGGKLPREGSIKVGKFIKMLPPKKRLFVKKHLLLSKHADFENLLENCRFVQNIAIDGGALFTENISLGLQRNWFLNNTAKSPRNFEQTSGGGVFLKNSEANITECVFAGNEAQYGGAVFGNGKPVFIQSSTFEMNQAMNSTRSQGGAVAVREPGVKGDLVILDSIFNENEADEGGAIFSDFHTRIENSVFHRNHASHSSGAVHSVSSHTSIKDCMFFSNNAGKAGALTMKSGEITQCSFDFNTATGQGGAMVISSISNVSISHTNFTNNRAGGGGGAIKGGRNVRFSCGFCSFKNNTVTYEKKCSFPVLPL